MIDPITISPPIVRGPYKTRSDIICFMELAAYRYSYFSDCILYLSKSFNIALSLGGKNQASDNSGVIGRPKSG